MICDWNFRSWWSIRTLWVPCYACIEGISTCVGPQDYYFIRHSNADNAKRLGRSAHRLQNIECWDVMNILSHSWNDPPPPPPQPLLWGKNITFSYRARWDTSLQPHPPLFFNPMLETTPPPPPFSIVYVPGPISLSVHYLCPSSPSLYPVRLNVSCYHIVLPSSYLGYPSAFLRLSQPDQGPPSLVLACRPFGWLITHVICNTSSFTLVPFYDASCLRLCLSVSLFAVIQPSLFLRFSVWVAKSSEDGRRYTINAPQYGMIWMAAGTQLIHALLCNSEKDR